MRGALTSVLYLFLGVIAAAADDGEAKRPFPVVTVDGEAWEDAKPDRAVIGLGAFAESPTAAEAATEIAKRASALVADIKAAGVEAKDIKTSSVRLGPIYV